MHKRKLLAMCFVSGLVAVAMDAQAPGPITSNPLAGAGRQERHRRTK